MQFEFSEQMEDGIYESAFLIVLTTKMIGFYNRANVRKPISYLMRKRQYT